MAYGEVFEGSGEELAGQVAALGKTRVRVVVLEPDQRPHADEIHELMERNEKELRDLMRGAPVLPDRSFTAEDFYGSAE